MSDEADQPDGQDFLADNPDAAVESGFDEYSEKAHQVYDKLLGLLRDKGKVGADHMYHLASDSDNVHLREAYPTTLVSYQEPEGVTKWGLMTPEQAMIAAPQMRKEASAHFDADRDAVEKSSPILRLDTASGSERVQYVLFRLDTVNPEDIVGRILHAQALEAADGVPAGDQYLILRSDTGALVDPVEDEEFAEAFEILTDNRPSVEE